MTTGKDAQQRDMKMKEASGWEESEKVKAEFARGARIVKGNAVNGCLVSVGGLPIVDFSAEELTNILNRVAVQRA